MRLLFLMLFIVPSLHAAPLKGDFNITDSALSSCIKQVSHKNNWQTIGDVKKLKCHGKGIADLTGLEQFTALESLSLYNNKVVHADLRSLKKLKHLNLANNKLKTVNIADLPQLQTLYLFKNQLTEINFAGLHQLTKLRITNNLLKHLDISPLTALEKAYFFDNKLEDLKVQTLPHLKFVELRQNPMPDEVYDRYDALDGITIVHDGNADDWK